MASAKTTTNHDEIRKWVEERGGCPARVKGTGGKSDAGLLRIDFPGFSGQDSLEKVPWEEFFKTFDENDLAFLHQDRTEDGKESRFFKFVERQGAAERKAA